MTSMTNRSRLGSGGTFGSFTPLQLRKAGAEPKQKFGLLPNYPCIISPRLIRLAGSLRNTIAVVTEP